MVKSAVDTKTVKIRDTIDKNLTLRFYADDFFNYIEEISQNKLIIDFYGINSISRSFAQQFLYRLSQSNKKIKIVNQSEDAIKLFDAVVSPRPKAVIV